MTLKAFSTYDINSKAVFVLHLAATQEWQEVLEREVQTAHIYTSINLSKILWCKSYWWLPDIIK